MNRFDPSQPLGGSKAPTRPEAKRRILFQHLQKTGGTSVVSLLENFFPANGSAEVGMLSKDRARHYIQSSQALFLHDNSYILNYKTANMFSFCFIREPFSRLLSARRQWTNASSEDIRLLEPAARVAVHAMQTMSFAEILDTIFDHPITVPLFWNHQTLSLGLTPLARLVFRRLSLNLLYTYFPENRSYRQWLERNRRNILNTAVAGLRSLDYVGLYEDFDDSVREVFTRIGLPEPESVPHLNKRAPHVDETNDAVKQKASPFIDLDCELYDVACELHARAGRAARGAPVDYVGRSIGSAEDRVFYSEDATNGHGWHGPALREDRRYSRWTGPGRRSYLRFGLDKGEYRIEIWAFGALCAEALTDIILSLGDRPLPTEVEQSEFNGHWLIRSTFETRGAGLIDLCLSVSATVNGFGIELEQFRIVGSESPTFRVDAYERYAETKRGAPSVPVELSHRSVGAGEDKIITMEGPFSEEGWHHARFRADGAWSRWTGPGRKSSFKAYLAEGNYGIELRMLGAVSEKAILGLSLSFEGEPLPVEIRRPADEKRWLAVAEMRCINAGLKAIGIEAAETLKGFGVEVESLRLIWISPVAPAGRPAFRRAAESANPPPA